MRVKKLTYKELLEYIGSRCEFRSNCEFFPNFHVIGVVTAVDTERYEYFIKVKTEPTGKEIPISSNMRNLTIEKL